MLDLGNGYTAEWASWSPDRSIEANAIRYKDVPDILKMSLLITCPHGKASLLIDRPEVREVFPNGPYWHIDSLEPLTLSPSILNIVCGCHGYIREGKWVNAN